jgi:hypothetical protein
MPDIGDLDYWKAESDRRSIGRTRITKGALLFFKGQPGTRGCNITDLTERGARIRTHDLPLVPAAFDLTLDNFGTIRRCRLVWRKRGFLGVAFED